MRGTVIAALERLVSKGVITDFEMPSVSNAIALHVVVTAPVVTNTRSPGHDREIVERVRRRVARELHPCRGDRDVLVSVRGIR